VLAVVACGATLVGVGVALLLVSILNLRSSADATLRSGMLLERVIAVERSVVDAETGLRGYVITGAPVFLAPLRGAKALLPGQTRTLLHSAETERNHVAAARRLGAAADAYVASYVPFVLGLMRSNRAQARSFAATLAGKHRVDAIRAQARRLERVLSEQQASHQRSAATTANDGISYAIIALVVLVVLTLAIEGTFGRLLLGRQRALRRSRDTTRILQTSLLPLRVPAIPECELAIRFRPAGAGELVGGDFYDVFELDGPDRWAVIVGDVCGKGAEAAATTAVARWTLRSASLLAPTPVDALQHLNEVMRRREKTGLFATITYLLLEIAPDHLDITVVCAGHPPPIVLAAGQPPTAVAAHGDLIGIWPRPNLYSNQVRLAPGDLIVAYTDGALEFTADPIQPLELALLDADTSNADAVAAVIEARALAAPRAGRDDVAIIAIRFNPSAQVTTAARLEREETT
jgi:sigma-B regulation protein RsbU (phosphoserine phosphatase)